ncbi:MAG: hypothetical protein ABI178_00500 [Rhodanobacter sp.]
MQTPVTIFVFSLRRSWLVRAAAALLAIGAVTAIPTPAHAGVYVSVNIAPPILPVYEQPIIPGDGYIWTPGYWAWSGDGYYWVPGTWVLPPYVGALWTPGYWGWGGGVYLFHRGYWGRHVGFYGGINYGYGYGGHGYEGGYWRGGGFHYNRSVNRVGGNIRNVYNRTVTNNTTIINNRVSFNGGPRGIAARATPQQAAWSREQHTAPVAAQLRQRDMASHVPALRASVNHGAPPIAATPRAGAFSGHGVAMARGASPAMAARDAREASGSSRVRTANSSNAMRPADTATRGNRAMRSASFAPHASQSMGSAHTDRYTPSAQQRGYAQPAQGRGNELSTAGNRGAAFRPQSGQARPYQPQAYRPAPDHARGPSRPANGRPAAEHAAASRGRAAPARHDDKRDDHQH